MLVVVVTSTLTIIQSPNYFTSLFLRLFLYSIFSSDELYYVAMATGETETSVVVYFQEHGKVKFHPLEGEVTDQSLLVKDSFQE